MQEIDVWWHDLGFGVCINIGYTKLSRFPPKMIMFKGSFVDFGNGKIWPIDN